MDADKDKRKKQMRLASLLLRRDATGVWGIRAGIRLAKDTGEIAGMAS
jgi:hypothetical protein